MKKLVFKFSLFIFGVTLILISYFTQPSAEINRYDNLSTGSIVDTQFQIGAIHDGRYSLYNYIKDALHFNVWHHYTELDHGWNDSYLDDYQKPINAYDTIVINKVNANNTHNLRTYFDRPTVSYIISGQRTDYECENVPDSSCLYWFNSYSNSVNNTASVNDVNDTSRYGGGARVKQCKTNNSPPELIAGYINTRIKANRNLSYGVAANKWCSDDAWDWYVMPRIRIDSVYASNSSNDTNTVCKVIITGWKGAVVKDISLRVENFKVINNTYNGNYIEQFNFGQGQEILKIDTATIKRHFLSDKVYGWNYSCGVDIKIYWTGKCDMWIDRVRLENVPAHQYLTLKDSILNSKINAEIGWANSNKNIPNYFYFEEFTFSHFPLIQALNKQILANSNPPNSNSLIIWYNDYQVNAQIPGFGHFSPAQVRAILKDSCKLKTIVIGWYGLEGWKVSELPGRISYHPNTLTDSTFNEVTGVLSYPESPAFYDEWLQNKIEVKADVTTIMDMNNLMSSLSKPVGTQSGLNVIYCPQAHSFLMKGGPLKEPTNEEIELQTNIALMHNTKGIMYYVLDSHGNFSYPDLSYCRGIMDTTDWNYFPQYNNYL